MVRDEHLDAAFGEELPHAFAVLAVADRRRALRLRSDRVEFFRREKEIVRAALETRVDAAGLGLFDGFDRFVAGAVRDVHAAARRLGDHENAPNGFDFREDGTRRDVVGDKGLARFHRFAAEFVRNRRVFAVHDDEAVDLGDFTHAAVELPVGDVLEVARLVGAAGCDESLEARDAGLGHRNEVGRVPGNEPAHGGVVDPAGILGVRHLEFERRDVGRGGDVVQRHLDEARDAARSHRLRPGFVAFPFGTAGFAQVHVRVDHAGEHVATRGVADVLRLFIDRRGDADDFPVLHADRRRFHTVAQHHAAVFDDEVQHSGFLLRTGC